MAIAATLKNLETGEERVYSHPNYLDEEPNKHGQTNASVAHYDWTEGNASCDCNRTAFFARAGDEHPDDYEIHCGEEQRFSLERLTVDEEDVEL